MADDELHDSNGQAEGQGHSAGHGGGPGGHGGGGHEEHEGAPEWLISFADNVMLQMGFFVILFALASKVAGGGAAEQGERKSGETAEPGQAGQAAAPSADMLDWAIAVREAFNNPVKVQSSDPGDAPLVARLIARNAQSEAREHGRRGNEHDIKSIRPGDYSSRGGYVPFARGAAGLDGSGEDALGEMLPHLRGHRNIIEIRGHVSAAEAYGKEDRGTALSYERSYAVARKLVAAGVPWSRLRLIACGDNDRVEGTTYDDAGHRLNQRVELIITDRAVPEYLSADPPPTTRPAGEE